MFCKYAHSVDISVNPFRYVKPCKHRSGQGQTVPKCTRPRACFDLVWQWHLSGDSDLLQEHSRTVDGDFPARRTSMPRALRLLHLITHKSWQNCTSGWWGTTLKASNAAPRWMRGCHRNDWATCRRSGDCTKLRAPAAFLASTPICAKLWWEKGLSQSCGGALYRTKRCGVAERFSPKEKQQHQQRHHIQ